MDITWMQIRTGYSGDRQTMIHGGNHTLQGFGWWQWDQSMAMLNDPACHSGIHWGGAICFTITDPDWSGDIEGRPWNGLVRGTLLGYLGDSGGTIWSPRSDGVWLVGVLKSVNENPSNPTGTYSHIGNLDDAISYLVAPVGMS